jgi:hypothetical protein
MLHRETTQKSLQSVEVCDTRVVREDFTVEMIL